MRGVKPNLLNLSAHARKRGSCVREDALSARWKSALGLVVSPEVESNRVAARRGGEQLEANWRSVG